jgi:hypothetical protein
MNKLAFLWRACGAVTGLQPVIGSRSGAGSLPAAPPS